MKNIPLKLSKLSIQSFVTSLESTEKLKGGTFCAEVSRGGPTICITGEQCATLPQETCHRTGNNGDPTGFITLAQFGCLSSN